MTLACLALAATLAVPTVQPPSATASPTPSAEPASIDGVTNYTRVDATIGCAGATESDALKAIAKLGYKTVVNLREESETGANIAEARAAAEALGLKYVHLPFRTRAPEARAADQFLELVTNPANQPVFIHCSSGNRAGGLWLIKRLLIDKWSEERALKEAVSIGLTSQSLQAFALEYARRPKS